MADDPWRRWSTEVPWQEDAQMIGTSMRRVVVTEAGVRIIEVPTPQPTAGEALVEMRAVGVCGSDIHAAAGHHPFVPLPYAPGHEVVGVVRSLGSDAATGDVAVGDRVVVEPTLPCWECKTCRTGRSNICENLRFFGCVHDQGGLADYFTIPTNRLHRVPDVLDDLQAVLIEPLATPVHAVRLSGGVDGKAVAVLGAGTIGLMTAKAAVHAGARRVIMTDPLASKRSRALRLVAHDVVDATAPDAADQVRDALGESADVVFDCVSIQPTVDLAFSLARKGGTVVTVGVPAAPVTVPLPEIQDLQMRLQGSATYMPEDIAAATAMISAGEITIADFITARFGFEAAADAFASASSGEQVKVVVTQDAE